MSAVEYIPFPAASPFVSNSTSPYWWGRAGWPPLEVPPPPPTLPSPSGNPVGHRRRKRGRTGRKATSRDRKKVEDKAWVEEMESRMRINTSALAEFFALNLTAEDMDYMLNISIVNSVGVLPWGGGNGDGSKGYALNFGHRRNNTTNAQKQRKKGDNQSNESCYCGNSESLLRRIAHAYRPLHPVAALTVCALGTLANALNVAVLTRPHLAPAPVNRILTAIAAADAALMAEYAAFAIIFCLPHSKTVNAESAPQSPTMTPAEEAARAERDYPFAVAAFVLFHMHFSQVLHTVSICLTLTLAVWRYLALRLPPERARILCSRRRCSVALAVSVLLPPFLCSPSYLVFGIATTHIEMGAQHPVAAAQEDPTLQPSEYPLGPGFMIPTVTMALDDNGISPISDESYPSASAALRQMAWGAAPPAADEEDEEREWTTVPPEYSWSTTFPDRTTDNPRPPSAVAVLYHVAVSDVAKDQGEMLYIVNFWVYAVILKLIPCLVLTVISVCLVRTLCRAKSRRRALQGQDVKKATQAKAAASPICKWRKKDDKVVLAVATPPRPEIRKEKPLDDGGVWMGREETAKEYMEDDEAEEQGTAREEKDEVEEEATTLVPEPSSKTVDGRGGGAVRKSNRWPAWLSLRKRRTSVSNEAGTQQQNAVATVEAAVRRRRRRTERTTRMLVAVLILFLVTEFPQGVLGLMSGFLGRCFFRNCYHIFGDLMDLLALLNGSINFILYCAMSRQFRQTFAQLFCKHPKLLWTSTCKSCPLGKNNSMEIMKNGNMGGEGLKRGATTVGGMPSQSMGEVQSTYV